MARLGKAVLAREANRPVVVETIEVESPRRDEIMVRVAACGVCHSDLSATNGTIAMPLPLILGHEGAGSVVEVGAGVTVNQLLGNRWSVGLGYHWTEVDLDSRVQGLPVSLGNTLDTFEESILHQATLSGRFYLECGFFAQANATWTRQASHGYRPSMPGEDFWQLDVYAGHRFWQRRAEVRVGVLNLTDDDYRLNPLTVHEEYVRARTFYTSLRLYF